LSKARNETYESQQYFQFGTYVFGFEFPIDSSLPETLKTGFGSVVYDLEVTVERPRILWPKLRGNLEVPVIRTLSEDSLEQTESALHSHSWIDRLKCDVLIKGRAFLIGSRIPISIRLTSLKEASCTQIKVYVIEKTKNLARRRRLGPEFLEKDVLIFDTDNDPDGAGVI
jgi:hypothetical protein